MSQGATSPARDAAGRPRYLQLAHALMGEIEAGRYPVGDLLPTEFELCDRYQASRFTVREAVKQLVQRGMVMRQAGIGTRVLSLKPDTAYRQVMGGMADLQHYTAETELEILDVEMAEPVGVAAAAAIPGELWLRVHGLRRLADASGPPIAVTDIYIHPDFRSVRHLGGRSTVPVYLRIEQQFGETIAEVRQQIRAAQVSRDHAGKLGTQAGAPALCVERTYLDRGGRVVEVATSVHPADRFTYSEVFRRERTKGPAGRP